MYGCSVNSNKLGKACRLPQKCCGASIQRGKILDAILHFSESLCTVVDYIYIYIYLNQQFWQLYLIVRSTQENWSVIWCCWPQLLRQFFIVFFPELVNLIHGFCWPQLLRQFFIVFFPELVNLYEDNHQFLWHWRVKYLTIIACYFDVFLQDWAIFKTYLLAIQMFWTYWT